MILPLCSSTAREKAKTMNWRKTLQEIGSATTQLTDAMKTHDETLPDAERFVQDCLDILNQHLDNQRFVAHLDNGGIPLHNELVLTRHPGIAGVVAAESVDEKLRPLTTAEIVERFGADDFGHWVKLAITKLLGHYQGLNAQHVPIHEAAKRRRAAESGS